MPTIQLDWIDELDAAARVEHAALRTAKAHAYADTIRLGQLRARYLAMPVSKRPREAIPAIAGYHVAKARLRKLQRQVQAARLILG